jgi:sarcosine oxidase
MSWRGTAGSREFDVAVVGLGGLGSAAAYWLARRGARVAGFEQFELGHVRGASHDHSRIIRRSYHTPGYVALTAAAYEAWHAVEGDADEEIITRTGGIDVFPAGAAIDPAPYRASLDDVDVPYEVIDAAEIRRRWPAFDRGTAIDGDVHAIYSADTGIVPAGRATATLQHLAVAYGAQLRPNTPVQALCPAAGGDGGEIDVVTASGTVRVERVVVCADAWTNRLLAPLGLEIPLTVTREQVTYFPCRDADLQPGRFPVWIWMDDPSFYGLPVFGEPGAVKAAEDVGGQPTTAATRTFDSDEAALHRLTGFLARTVPGMVDGRTPRVKTCLYTLTPDRDFVLGDVPGHPGVQVALGAAHGYKFASWFGRTLAERAVHGSAGDDLAPFRIDRPVLLDPNPPVHHLV